MEHFLSLEHRSIRHRHLNITSAMLFCIPSLKTYQNTVVILPDTQCTSTLVAPLEFQIWAGERDPLPQNLGLDGVENTG